MTRDAGDRCPELPAVRGAGSDGVLAWPQQQRLPWPRRAGCRHFAVSHLCPTGATNEAGTAPDPRASGPPSDSIKEGQPLPRGPGSQPWQLVRSQQDSPGPGITGAGLRTLSVGSGDRVLTPARLPSTKPIPRAIQGFARIHLKSHLGVGAAAVSLRPTELSALGVPSEGWPGWHACTEIWKSLPDAGEGARAALRARKGGGASETACPLWLPSLQPSPPQKVGANVGTVHPQHRVAFPTPRSMPPASNVCPVL